jgi:hypothetical protein
MVQLQHRDLYLSRKVRLSGGNPRDQAVFGNMLHFKADSRGIALPLIVTLGFQQLDQASSILQISRLGLLYGGGLGVIYVGCVMALVLSHNQIQPRFGLT